jgi:pyruvate carboxylase
MGGGGRGMRVVESADGLDSALDQARREAQTAFGDPSVFLEKFIRRAKHIEVQLLGDRHGNLVHLLERDCSVQRRHQKVVEIAPAYNLDPVLRRGVCDAAIRIGRHVGYDNAGTVEFLVDVDAGAFYFIEVNPRIQVEHTVTEMVTGVDLIKSQILIAQDVPLSDPEINLPDQSAVQAQGFASSAGSPPRTPRTSSRPTTAGSPTTGRPAASGSGSTAARRPPGRSSRPSMTRCWSRSRPRAPVHRRGPADGAGAESSAPGVRRTCPSCSTSSPPRFLEGRCTTRFIDETPSCSGSPSADRATKL